MKYLLPTVTFLIIILTSCDSSNNSQVENRNANKSTTTPTNDNAVLKEPFIIESIDLLKQNFNNYARNNNLDFKINEIQIEKGEVKNSFTYMFNENIGIVGGLNKSDNSIHSLTMIAMGDGTLSSGADIIVLMIGIIAVADPSINPDDRAKILKQLGLFDKENDIANMESHTIQNGLKYSISSSSATGIWFSVDKAG